MKKINLILLMAVTIGMLITGCASIMSGTTQQVTFQSSPDGALVKINGKPLGKTPLTMQLDKDKNQTLTVEKEGYKTFTTSMDTRLDSWFWGNVVLGGVFGSTTDSINGAVYEYNQSQYMVTLEPLKVSQMEIKAPALSQREKARRFLYANYGEIRNNLSSGSGEFIDATLLVLNVNQENSKQAIEQMKSSMFELNNPDEFINQTLNKNFS